MADDKKRSVFETLNAINVNGHTETKDTGRVKLTYLSWAWAWSEVKKAYPLAFYTVYENKDGLNYHTDGRTCWVKTGVTIEGLEHIEYLPVMDNRNQSIPLERVTSFEVNKAIQRSLTKAVARHGLGLYIYAGEDLPEDVSKDPAPAKTPAAQQQRRDVSITVTDSVTPAPAASDLQAKLHGTTTTGTTGVRQFTDTELASMRAVAERLGVDGKGLNALKNKLAAAGKVSPVPFNKMTSDELLRTLAVIEKESKPA